MYLRSVSCCTQNFVRLIRGRRNFHVSAATRDIFTVQDENDFESKVANSKVPVVIDFYANWCGPCKILTPRLETIIYEQQDKVNLAKIDVDANEDLAQRFQVTALPSVFAMKNGKVVDKFTGVRDDDEVRLFVEKLAN